MTIRSTIRSLVAAPARFLSKAAERALSEFPGPGVWIAHDMEGDRKQARPAVRPPPGPMPDGFYREHMLQAQSKVRRLQTRIASLEEELRMAAGRLEAAKKRVEELEARAEYEDNRP